MAVLLRARSGDGKGRRGRRVPGLERAVAKSKGAEFGSLLHEFGADYSANPYSSAVRDMLLQINPDCASRLPKRRLERPARKSPEPACARKACQGQRIRRVFGRAACSKETRGDGRPARRVGRRRTQEEIGAAQRAPVETRRRQDPFPRREETLRFRGPLEAQAAVRERGEGRG